MEASLPHTCGLSSKELRERMLLGIPPDTPEEYLARGLLEANALPNTVVFSPAAPAPPPKRPSPSWAVPAPIAKIRIPVGQEERFDNVLASFQLARAEVLQWDSQPELELLPVQFPQSPERTQWIEFFSQTPPLLHVVLRLSHVEVTRSLRHYTKAFSLDPAMLAQHEHASWVFALLAKLSVPYTDDVASCLSSLLRLVSLNQTSVNDELQPAQVLYFVLERFFNC